jgi:hypothetical protein
VSADNPEANETANLFFAAVVTTTEVEDFAYSFSLDAADYEERFRVDMQGIVYVSDRSWPDKSVFFQGLDVSDQPLGAPGPLTDATVSSPANPAVSADGRFLWLDAASGAGQRIHVLDLSRATVRRSTVDPFGSSLDMRPSLSPDLSRFAFINNRQGALGLSIDDVATGLGPGVGTQTLRAVSHQQNDGHRKRCPAYLAVRNGRHGFMDRLFRGRHRGQVAGVPAGHRKRGAGAVVPSCRRAGP